MGHCRAWQTHPHDQTAVFSRTCHGPRRGNFDIRLVGPFVGPASSPTMHLATPPTAGPAPAPPSLGRSHSYLKTKRLSAPQSVPSATRLDRAARLQQLVREVSPTVSGRPAGASLRYDAHGSLFQVPSAQDLVNAEFSRAENPRPQTSRAGQSGPKIFDLTARALTDRPASEQRSRFMPKPPEGARARSPVPVQMWQGWAQSRCRCDGNPAATSSAVIRRVGMHFAGPHLRRDWLRLHSVAPAAADECARVRRTQRGNTHDHNQNNRRIIITESICRDDHRSNL